MSRRLFVLPAAQDDIAAAAAWYESMRRGLGLALLEKVDELLQRVAEAPHQFPTIQPSVRRGLTRRFPYGVYFTVSEDRVDVLAVIHLHRHQESWKRGR
jgi:plasmid stabilization system protein ParE